METFKRYDLLVSLFLIISGTIISLIRFDFTFIYCYFITGGWQVISMLAHAGKGWFVTKGSMRNIYHWLVAIILGIALLGFLISSLLFIFYILLFIAPAMAVFYTLLCYCEVKELRKRHAFALK